MTHAEALEAIRKVRDSFYGREVQQAIYDGLLWCLAQTRPSDITNLQIYLNSLGLCVLNGRLCQTYDPDGDIIDVDSLYDNGKIEEIQMQQILDALYGKEVRQIIHDLLLYCLTQSDDEVLDAIEDWIDDLGLSVQNGMLYLEYG